MKKKKGAKKKLGVTEKIGAGFTAKGTIKFKNRKKASKKLRGQKYRPNLQGE